MDMCGLWARIARIGVTNAISFRDEFGKGKLLIAEDFNGIGQNLKHVIGTVVFPFLPNQN